MKGMESSQNNREGMKEPRHISWLDKDRKYQLSFTEILTEDLNEFYESGRLVIYDNQGEQIVDVADLFDLPKKDSFSVHLLKGRNGDNAHGSAGYINIPVHMLKDKPREIFTVLHELGHSKLHQENTELALDDNYDRLIGVKYARNPSSIDNETIKAARERMVSSERDAWAQAIKAARRLKTEYNVDLFNLFENTDDFLGWIRSSGLYSYEKALHKVGGDKPTKEDLIKKEGFSELFKTIAVYLRGLFKK